jgi:hypothetical protein
VYDWSKSLKGQAEGENMQRQHLLQGKLWTVFSGILKASYYSKLLKVQEKQAFHSKLQG